jgi:hypothetical protein
MEHPMPDILTLTVGLLGLAIFGVLIAAALKPGTFRVERSLRISAPADKVFSQINNLKAMNRWNPFVDGHPANDMAYSGHESGKGAAYDWDVPGRPGKGHIEITNATPPASVDLRLVMQRPMVCDNQIKFTLQPAGSATDVTWAITGPWPYLNRVMGTLFSMDKMVGGQFEKGLAALKAIAER